MVEQLQGQCLCGAVQISASVDNPRLRACHCDMCRQHTSGAFFSIETVPDTIEVTGPATEFKSSDWANRGFCGMCGSTLWYGFDADRSRNLSAGLFPDAGGGQLKIEFFYDQWPQVYALAGDPKKLTTDQTLALFAPNDGDAQ